MKKIVSMLLSLILIISVVPMEVCASGTENVDIDESTIYTEWLLDGGYTEITRNSWYFCEIEYWEVSTCLADFDEDGVDELLIQIIDKSIEEFRGCPEVSALLDIGNGEVEIILESGYYGGTIEGGALEIKYDQLMQKNVIVEESWSRDGNVAIDTFFQVYSGVGFKQKYDIRMQYYDTIFCDYYDDIIKKNCTETDLYIKDGGTYYFYTINGEYVLEEDYNRTLRYFVDQDDEKYQMHAGTYDMPIKTGFDSEENKEGDESNFYGYADVLNMYYESISCGWTNCDGEGWNNVGDPDNACYILWHYEFERTLSEIGYALWDINNDGQLELFIDDIESNRCFYDMYTIFDEEVIHVISAGERDHYSLGEDYTINNDGSGSAVSNVHINYCLDNKTGTLKINQAVIYNEWEDSDNPYFYATEDYYIEGTYDYNYDVLKSISKEQALEILDSFPKNIELEVTPFDKYQPEEIITDGFEVYSDYDNFTIRKGGTITVGVKLYKDGKAVEDLSNVVYYVGDNEILNPLNRFFYTEDSNNVLFVKLKAKTVGTSYIVFNDTESGVVKKIPINVYEDGKASFTLNTVPEMETDEGIVNLYGTQGLYIDSYDYYMNNDGSAHVSFDVYNTNYTYGAVEVYDADGNLYNAALIHKKIYRNRNIKESLIDNSYLLAKDFLQGELLSFSYKAESHYSQHTPISVDVPKGGYIKIETSPQYSSIVALINGADILMQLKEVVGDLKGYGASSEVFSDKLTKKILYDKAYVELVQNSEDFSKELYKNITLEATFSTEAVGDFADTFIRNVSELELENLILDTVADMGWEVGESLFTYFSGIYGKTLNVMFTAGKGMNIINQHNSYVRLAEQGCIYIFNQGGGIRGTTSVQVKSEADFSDDITLNVFKVEPNSELLSAIKQINPKKYEELCGIHHIYNISLLKKGEEVQPNGKVEVSIQIPKDLEEFAYLGQVKIYRMEADGTLTEMDTRIEDGRLVFETEHFSLYAICGFDEDANNYICDTLEYEYEVRNDGGINLTRYNGTDERIRIPSRIDGYVVKQISANCFGTNAHLVEIKIPACVEVIEEGELIACPSLERIVYEGTCQQWNNMADVDELNSMFDVTTGHMPGAKATCVTARKCEGCSIILAEALGHDLIRIADQDSTYTQVGYAERYFCTRCRKIVRKGKVIAVKKLKTPKFTFKTQKGKLKIKYKKVPDATGFVIKYKKASSKKWTTKTYKTKKTATKTIKKLSKGKYKIKAYAFVKEGKKFTKSKVISKTVKIK